jgi:hypothetical protein
LESLNLSKFTPRAVLRQPLGAFQALRTIGTMIVCVGLMMGRRKPRFRLMVMMGVKSRAVDLAGGSRDCIDAEKHH